MKGRGSLRGVWWGGGASAGGWVVVEVDECFRLRENWGGDWLCGCGCWCGCGEEEWSVGGVLPARRSRSLV